MTPSPVRSVGSWYEDFRQTTDEEAQRLLAGARRRRERPFAALTGDPRDLDDLVDRARDARYVLLGEATHGTHEFYRERAEITKRLIAAGGCTAVAVEADWPDAYRVNRYVRGAGDDASAEEALAGFRRFPVWMWRNTDVAAFVRWLRAHNDALPETAPKVGFYGLDLYSLHSSMDEVVRYLAEVDPAAERRARERYSCFEHFGTDPQVYAYEAGLGGAEPCERQAVEQLLELRRLAGEAALADCLGEDRRFYAEMNAQLVVDAEAYYRAAFRGGHESWNERDRHMARTLDALVSHLGRDGAAVRAVVWEHNSHVGDARATQMGEGGRLNVGQLVRERHPGETFLVGFTTYAGTVTAASGWGAEGRRRRVRPALAGSWEELLHEQGLPAFVVDAAALEGSGPQRAIGVVYRPETERLSHYFDARIAEQFDAVIHIDETSAVQPLEPTGAWRAGVAPDEALGEPRR
jgi:erythromycin esterase-like protein